MELKENFSHLKAMIKKEYLIFTRYPIRIFSSFALPIFLLIIFGFSALSFLDQPTSEDVERVALFFYIGILGYIYLDTVSSAATGLREEQFQGTLESLFLTPASRPLNIFARIIFRIIFMSLNIIIIYIVVAVLIKPIQFSNPYLGFMMLIMLIIQLMGLGFFSAALTIKLKETAIFISNLLIFFIMIFSAFMFTFDTFRDGILYWIPRILPTSYTVDAMRSLFMGLPPGFPELLPIFYEVVIAIVSAIGLLVLGILYYIKIERQTRKRAELVEY